MGLDVEQIYEFGLDAVVSRYVERYHRELFFEKHSDWASEAEYRWVFVNPEPSPVYVDVSTALTGSASSSGVSLPRTPPRPPRLFAVGSSQR